MVVEKEPKFEPEIVTLEDEVMGKFVIVTELINGV